VRGVVVSGVVMRGVVAPVAVENCVSTDTLLLILGTWLCTGNEMGQEENIEEPEGYGEEQERRAVEMVEEVGGKRTFAGFLCSLATIVPDKVLQDEPQSDLATITPVREGVWLARFRGTFSSSSLIGSRLSTNSFFVRATTAS